MTNLNKLVGIVTVLTEAHDLMVELNQLDVSDLQMYYDLTETEARLLFLVIKGREEKVNCAYSLTEAHGNALVEMVTEAIHQGLDGWEPDERIVIEAFLADLAEGTYLTHESNLKRGS